MAFLPGGKQFIQVQLENDLFALLKEIFTKMLFTVTCFDNEFSHEIVH